MIITYFINYIKLRIHALNKEVRVGFGDFTLFYH